MAKDAEELKIILDMAANGGKMLALPNDADPAEIVTQITEQQKLLD